MESRSRGDSIGVLRLVCVGLIAAVTALALPAVDAAEMIDRVLAVVGGIVITQSDAKAALALGLVQAPTAPAVDPLRTTLDQLIRRELILAEVNRYGTTDIDASAVTRRMAAIRDRFPSPEAYQAALAVNAMTETRLRDMVEADVRIDQYIDQRFGEAVEPTDDEIAEYYSNHQADLTAGGQPLTLEQARPRIRRELVEEKRSAAIEQWVSRLRRRTDVTDLYFASGPRSTADSRPYGGH